MTKKRGLTDEEKKLWKQVTSGDKPLARRRALEDGCRVSGDGKKKPVVKPILSSRFSSDTRHPSPVTQPVVVGAYANIDRNTAERFRKGETPIDGTLDLHGMTREKAHRSLEKFLDAHWRRGSRCLLVITGKGVRKSEDDDERRGVLRELFPQWLSEMGAMVLAFDSARPKHGGTGAFYVLLKRQRA